MTSTALDASRVESLLEDFDNTMLVTHADGRLHARPMRVVERSAGGSLYLVSGADSGKVAEIEANAAVTLTFQDARQFLVLSGGARPTRDRALIERLWSDAWRVWFPQGKEDPNICLIQVEPTEAEYWDNRGARGLKYAFQAARAYATGHTPRPDPDQHGKVRL